MAYVSHQQELDQGAIWQEIVNILQPDKTLDVFQIIRQSNVLERKHKKTMNRLLYSVNSNQVIQEEQSRGKPKWRLSKYESLKQRPKRHFHHRYKRNSRTHRTISNIEPNKDEDIWNEMHKILSPNKCLNVLEIMRRSNMLQHRDKKAMNRVLYRIRSDHVLRVEQSRGKPKWRLTESAPYRARQVQNDNHVFVHNGIATPSERSLIHEDEKWSEISNDNKQSQLQFSYKNYVQLGSHYRNSITWYQCLTQQDVAFYSTYPAEWCWNMEKKWIKFQQNYMLNPQKAAKCDSNRFWFGDVIVCDLLNMKVINNQSGYQFDLKRTDTLCGTLMQFGQIKFQRYYNVKQEIFLYDRRDINENNLAIGDRVRFKVRWNHNNQSRNTLSNNRSFKVHSDMIAFDIKPMNTNQRKRYKLKRLNKPDLNGKSTHNATVVVTNKKTQIQQKNNVKVIDSASSSVNTKHIQHISSVISSPFEESNSSVSCYIYCIQFDPDPYKEHPMGMVLSKQMDTHDVKDIRFPIEMNQNEENQWTQIIKQWTEHNVPLNESVPFDISHVVKAEISLDCVQSKYNKDVHKLSKTQFKMIKMCNKFIFEKLDQRQQCKLKPIQSERVQKRFYYICPLKYSVKGSDDLMIDNECLQRMYLASGALNDQRLNAKQFIQNIPTFCSLKHEIVEVMPPKKEKTTIGISYGLHQHKNRVGLGLVEVESFVSQDIIDDTNKLKGINKNKLLYKASRSDILLVREEDAVIEDVSSPLKTKQIRGSQLQCLLSYRVLTDCFPTGITTNLWYKLKTLPSILCRIEAFFNVIDLRKRLYNLNEMHLHCDAKTDDIHPPIHIALKLLFDALDRSASGNMMYQILNNIGSYVLKFISTLHTFTMHPTFDHKALFRDVVNMTKKSTSHDARVSVLQSANRLNIISYAILHGFDYKKWSPPQFQERNDKWSHSVVDSGKHFECFLLQSVIGAVFVSSMKHQYTHAISNALMNVTNLSKSLGIIDDDDKEVFVKEKQVLCKVNDYVYALKQNAIADELKMNIMLQRSLKTVVENDDYTTEGITFKRLEFLGDAVLDLLIIWFICYNFIDDSNLSKMQNEKASLGQYITDIRHRFVSADSLGFKFIDNGLDEYIVWFDDNTRNAINQYKDKIKKWKKDARKPLPSPSVCISKYSYDDEWPLDIPAPAILADCYEAILGAIFIGSHPDIFKKKSLHHRNCLLCSGYLRSVSDCHCISHDIVRLFVLFYGDNGCDWNLRPCIDFLCSTLNLRNQRDWSKWASHI